MTSRRILDELVASPGHRRAARPGRLGPSDRRALMTGRMVLHGGWVVLRLALAVVAAAVAGLAALVGVAAVSARPVLFLAAGLLVFLAATAAGVGLATRKLPGDRRRRIRLTAFGAGALGGVAVFVVTALLPVGDPQLPPAPAAGQRWWALPTGSQVAYVHLPAHGAPRPTPVVFLHGGPGIADMAGDAAYFGQLTGDGLRRVGLRPGRHGPLRSAGRPEPVHHRPQRGRPGGHPPAHRRRPAGAGRPLLGRSGRGRVPGRPSPARGPGRVLLTGAAGPRAG